MIFVCELGFVDGGHVPFNAGLLATVRAAFPEEELFFFGAPRHIEELKKQLDLPLVGSVSWTEIVPPNRAVTYSERFFHDLKMIRPLLKTLGQDPTSLLILTSAYPSTLLALKLAMRFRFDKTKVQVVLHGSLSGVVGRRYRRPIRRFQEMRTALTILGNSNIQYIILEESARDTLLRNVPSLSGTVEALDHPVSPNEAGSHVNDLDAPVRFGFLGLANESKGFPLFLKLAKEVTAKYGHRAEFHVIGRLPSDGRPAMGVDALATKPGMTRMSRADFIQGVQQLHFIILPHQPEPYELSASGTLLDAIAWEKPVLARKIPIFENLFEKHGDVGYLFGDDMQLGAIVEQILQTVDKARYRSQVVNIQNARHYRNPAKLAASYREICRKHQGAVVQAFPS